MAAETINSILPDLMRWLPTMAAAGGLDGFAREVHANLTPTMRRLDVARVLGDSWRDLLREAISDQLTYRLGEEIQREYDLRIEAYEQASPMATPTAKATVAKLIVQDMTAHLSQLMDALTERIAAAQGVTVADASPLAQADQALEQLIDALFSLRDRLRAPGMAATLEAIPGSDRITAAMRQMADATQTIIKTIPPHP